MTDETDDESTNLVIEFEKLENLLVVLDDRLEFFLNPHGRRAVVEFIFDTIGIEPVVFELWQHLNNLTIESSENETPNSQH